MDLLSEEIQQKPQTGSQKKQQNERQLDLGTWILSFIFEHFASDLRAEPPPRLALQGQPCSR